MVWQLNLPYKVPFDAHFSYGTGFFIWWMACFCAVSVIFPPESQ